MPTEPGQTLSHYRLIEKIGEGGMGVVWRARGTTFDREVAVKILPEEFAAHADRLARFEGEAKAVATLEWVAWYNSQRLLEPIGYAPPVEYEAMYYRDQMARAAVAEVR